MSKDYYATLGVSRTADPAVIHSAFRNLARRYHPDAGRTSSSGKFREAVEAYETLRDPARRRQHDIDLGFAASAREPAAEPLFAPRFVSSARPHSFDHTRSTLDDLFDEIIRFIDPEFDYSLDFF